MIIDALVDALLSYKLNSMKEIENLNMTIADIESREINNNLSFDEISEVMKQKPKIVTLADALYRIA